MGLPRIPLSTGKVEVGGETIEVRGLSRAEVMRLPSFKGDLSALDVFVLSRGTGASEDVAAKWCEETGAAEVDVVVNRIVELSGLGDEVSKSDGAGPAAG